MTETMCDYSKWFYLCCGFLAVIVIIVIVSYRYNIYLDKKSIRLEQSDRDNKGRIKELEKKNGHEQRQINQLKEEIKHLKQIINDSERQGQT